MVRNDRRGEVRKEKIVQTNLSLATTTKKGRYLSGGEEGRKETLPGMNPMGTMN